MNTQLTTDLESVLAAYCQQEGLPDNMSADELLYEFAVTMTSDQRKWFIQFIQLWDLSK